MTLADSGSITRYGATGLLVDSTLVSIPQAHAKAQAAPPVSASRTAEQPVQLRLSEAPQTEPLMLAQATPAADGAPASGGALKFEIRRYKVEGNTLLQSGEIERTLKPFTGKQKDFGDVQHALEALQNAYQKLGYTGVLVTLPEQELEKGEVRFTVIETKIGKITVQGNEHFSAANIRRSVPALVEGTTPNAEQIAASVRVANENPAKQTAVLLKAGAREDEADATIRVADVDPSKYSISFDNTGNVNTGKYRVGFAYQNANLWDRDHVLTAQYLTSPQNPSKVTVLGLGYRIPLYARGDSVDLVAGYSDVDSGTVQDLFLVTGRGVVYAVRYNHMLPKWGDLEHKLVYGIDYRAYQNSVLPAGGGTVNLVPDVTLHPLSVTYSGVLRKEQRELSYYASVSQNIFANGNDAGDSNFKADRMDSRAAYRIYRFGGSYSRAFQNDWQTRVNFNAQYTRDALVAGEQFGLGGIDSIRGFNERYVSNDRGYRTNFELYTPDLASRFKVENARLRFVAFYDTGNVHRNRRLAGELQGASLDSVGIGLRLTHKNSFTLRADYAEVLHDGSQFGTPAGRVHANRLHFSMAWVF